MLEVIYLFYLFLNMYVVKVNDVIIYKNRYGNNMGWLFLRLLMGVLYKLLGIKYILWLWYFYWERFYKGWRF